MKYVIKKSFALIITLFIVSFLAFWAFSVIPGDPTTRLLGTEATPEAAAALRAQMGLDLPLLQRYGTWLTSFLKGNFGTSYTYSMPVADMLADKLPVTALLVLLSFLITAALSLPLGVLAGSLRTQAGDRLFLAIDQLVMAVPAFFVGVLVNSVCGLTLRWFIPGKFISYTVNPVGCLRYLVFPAFSIAVPRIAMTVRMLRSSIHSELNCDYVRTAQSRGNGRTVILLRHVLRNALIPVISFLAVSMAEIVTGSIIIEQVFTVPGIGRLLLASINNRDFPVVQAIIVLLATWIVLVNFAADLINQLADPRLRLR